jgi:hypothetical protein
MANLLLAAPDGNQITSISTPNQLFNSICVCSLGANGLKAEGAKHLCDALKVNETLTTL